MESKYGLDIIRLDEPFTYGYEPIGLKCPYCGIIEITDDPIDKWSDSLLVSPWEKGELVVRGPIVTHEYFEDPYKTDLSKIKDKGTIWHRMGDIVWRDDTDRLWF